METKEALSIHVEKDFPVPADQLYKAWTSSEDLKQWWHPMGNQLKEVNLDIREGGSYEYVFDNTENQHTIRITGQYEEVKENQRLVYSWNWIIPNENVNDSQFRLILDFIQQENGSRLSVTQENIASEENLQPHQEGWEKALNDLHAYLSNK